MAVTAIVPIQLVSGAGSLDWNLSDGTTATSQTDGWAITLGTQGDVSRLFFAILDDGTGTTVIAKAGDAPAAANAAKGDATLTALAASDARYYTLEPGRHEQNDNTVHVVCVDAGAKMTAFLMPVAILGGSGIA